MLRARDLMKRPAFAMALFGLAALAGAQQDAFDFYFADVTILQLKPIQSELKVTETQRINMNKHADWLKGQGTAIDSQVRSGKLTKEEGNRQMAGHLATLKRRVLGELNASQLKRLREITLQRDGLLPLMDQKMADKIGMTKAQLTKLREGYVESNEKAKEIQQTAFSPIFAKYEKMKPKDDAEKKTLNEQANKELDAARKKILPQLEALGKSFASLVETTLTKGQRDAFAALKGKPFEVPKGG
jgi:hypothetical protein